MLATEAILVALSRLSTQLTELTLEVDILLTKPMYLKEVMEHVHHCIGPLIQVQIVHIHSYSCRRVLVYNGGT